MRNRIIQKTMVSYNTISLWIYHPEIVAHYHPGQFIILRIDEKGERIPLTIVDVNLGKQSFRLLFQIVGYTTNKLAQLNVGDVIRDILGPLGKAIEIPDNTETVLFVGGGLGIAPLFPKIKDSKSKGLQGKVILGARTKDQIILEDEIKKIYGDVIIMTDDGSYGEKGFVTNAIEELHRKGYRYDLSIVIGPLAMMRAATNLNRTLGLPTLVSLNPIMVDGTGMCGGCRFHYGNEVKFACVDGPVFDAFKVNYDDLIQRNNQYREEECRLNAFVQKK